MDRLRPHKEAKTREAANPERRQGHEGGSGAIMLEPHDVAAALKIKRWYGDGPPTWSGAPTKGYAAAISKTYAKRLRRKTNGADPSTDQLALARILYMCRPGQRCGCGHCPKCGRAVQRMVVHQILAQVAEASDELVTVSIVPGWAYAFAGDLDEFDFGDFLEHVCLAVSNSGFVKWAFVGVDFSFNLLANGLRNRWQVQAYCIAEITDRKKLKAYLSRLFPKSRAVTKPLVIKQFDGSAYGASYAFKFQFARRISYVGKNGRRQTKKRRLQASEHIELMHVLADIGFSGRIRLIVLGPKAVERTMT